MFCGRRFEQRADGIPAEFIVLAQQFGWETNSEDAGQHVCG